MGIWIEIHCDVRLEGNHPKNILRPRCLSAENTNPMGMSANNQANVLRLMRDLGEEAKKIGWAKVGGQWACPGCRGMKEY